MNILIFIQFFVISIYIVIILLFSWYWRKIKVFKTNKNVKCSTSVSIIIPARNEEKSIPDLLNDLSEQIYPKELIEIIIIDDHSTDNTYQKISDFKKLHPDLNIEILKNSTEEINNLYKKAAITLAVNKAKGKLIFTTDADCRIGKYWLHSIVEFYENTNAKFISGPVILSNEKTFFEKLQIIEFTGLIGVGAASIKAGVPIMCNGANIAYERQAFIETGGYKMDKNASGDDVFLMFKISEKYPGELHFIKSTDAIVYTAPQKSIKGFFHQRKRWASKVNKYKSPLVLFVAASVFFVNVILLSSIVFLFFMPSYAEILCWQLALKMLVDFIFVYSIETFFNRRNLLYLFIPGQILNIFYVTIIAAISPFGKFVWKGRRLK